MTKPSVDYLERYAKKFGDFAVWVFDHRIKVLLGSLLLLLTAAYLASSVTMDASVDSLFSENDPTYRHYYEYRDDFGSDEIAFILYRFPDAEHGVFDLDGMKKIAKLSAAIEQEVPFVHEVTSLSTAEFMEADGDDIVVHEILHEFPDSQKKLLDISRLILNKPIYVNNIVSADGQHGAIIVEMTRASTDTIERARLDPAGGDGMDNLYPYVSGHAISDILARPEYQGIQFYNGGDVEMNTVYNELGFGEPPKQMLFSALAIMVLGFVLLRTGAASLIGPLLVVFISMITMVAFISVLGWDITLIFGMTPNLLIAIGVAQSVHLLSEFQLARSRGLVRRDALRHTMELVGTPCFLAALSTALGFLAMAVSELKAISQVAVYGSFGVMVAFFLTLTLLIALLSFGDNKPEKSGRIKNHVATRLTSGLLAWVIKINFGKPKLIVLLSLLFLAVSSIGVSKLRVDFNFLTDFQPYMKIRQDTEYIDHAMGGTLSLVYVFESEEDGLKDPEKLKQLERFQVYAESQPLVQKTLSIVDVLKDLNQTFHGDNPDFYQLPNSRELVAQYLLMYELSGGDQLTEYMSSDFAKAVVDLRVDMVDSSQIQELLDVLNHHLDDSLKTLGYQASAQKTNAIPAEHFSYESSGVGLLWATLANYIASSFTQGYILVFLMLFVLMCSIFRSIKVGLLAMVPNITPIIITMGYMGWAGINLDYVRLMVGSIAIGIAVDDTVHVMTRIRQEFHRCGHYTEAVISSIQGIGHALVNTTLILIACFSVFYFSDLSAMASFGSLMAVSISAALLADLFLLPVLIVYFKPFGSET